MSTPSTATAVHHPLHTHFFPHYSDYQPSTNGYRTNSSSNNSLTRLALSTYGTNNSTPDCRQNTTTTTASQVKPPQQPPLPQHAPLTQSPRVSQMSQDDMSSSQRREKKTNWNDFYRNGLPKEVIVIEDDSPEPSTRRTKRDRDTPEEPPRPVQMNGLNGHTDKRRRVDANTSYDPVYDEPPTSTKLPANTESTSLDTNSRDRTTSALYSTAPTSLGSSTGSGRGRKVEETQIGQKRKRPTRKADEEEEEDIAALAKNDTYNTYIPPSKPIHKASEVYVQVIRDVSAIKAATQLGQGTKSNQKGATTAQKFDDDDGHYIVTPNADFTERCESSLIYNSLRNILTTPTDTITRLLGQGTFGKVVEAYDKQKRVKCAVKIIRAVQKYRDASRIELRVLKTLASNDKYNRNKCIHLRDCFDFRNHICIVTDLLSSSVFDFLKNNSFVPFPSSHIQQFARQLLTSVACELFFFPSCEPLANSCQSYTI